MAHRLRRMQTSARIEKFPHDASFGARLRHERERQKISIASIAESTKILGALLEGLEKDDVSRWPTGFYRRAFIRAYARAIRLDPDTVVREFVARFPEPEDIPPAPEPAPERRPRTALLRFTLARTGIWFVGGRLMRKIPARLGAVVFDASVLGSLALGLFVALDAFWAPLSLAAACYYSGSILILGNTPGVCVYAPRPNPFTKRPAASM